MPASAQQQPTPLALSHPPAVFTGPPAPPPPPPTSPDAKSSPRATSFKELENEVYDYIFKVVIVGESGVGKSSLIKRFCDESFSLDLKPTIGVEFESKTLAIDSSVVKVQIWDTAGQERYRAVASSYYRGASGALLVYDVTFEPSFAKCRVYWLKEMRDHNPDAIVMLVGNKTDLPQLRTVPSETGLALAKEKDLLFVEASAKSSSGVESGFTRLLTTIHGSKKLRAKAQDTRSRDPVPLKKGSTIQLSFAERRTIKQNNRNRCC